MSEPGFDLYRIRISPEAINCLRARLARELQVVPVEFSDHGAVVAMAAESEDNLDKLRFIWNRPVSVVYATPESIRFALAKYYPE